MKYRLLVICGVTAGVIGSSGSAAAQNLQDSQTNLQQRTGQTQDTGRIQNQTAPLQTNNSGTLLTQTQPGSLSVVSSPSQTQADVTVGASTDTTNAPGQTSDSNQSTWQILAIISIVGLGLSLYAYSRLGSGATVAPIEAITEEPINKKVVKPKQPKKSKAKKKKKKAHHH